MWGAVCVVSYPITTLPRKSGTRQKEPGCDARLLRNLPHVQPFLGRHNITVTESLTRFLHNEEILCFTFHSRIRGMDTVYHYVSFFFNGQNIIKSVFVGHLINKVIVRTQNISPRFQCAFFKTSMPRQAYGTSRPSMIPKTNLW